MSPYLTVLCTLENVSCSGRNYLRFWYKIWRTGPHWWDGWCISTLLRIGHYMYYVQKTSIPDAVFWIYRRGGFGCFLNRILKRVRMSNDTATENFGSFSGLDLITLIGVLTNTMIQCYQIYRSGYHRIEIKDCKWCGTFIYESDTDGESKSR